MRLGVFPAVVAVLAGATLVACSRATPAVPGQPLASPDGTAIVFSPTVVRARVLFLHGLGSDPAQAAAAHPVDRLIRSLVGRGWEVVVAPEPFDGPNQYPQSVSAIRPDGGAGFRAQWLARWDRLTAWANGRLGPTPTTVVGESWGGLLALMAACERSIIAVGLLIPVVDVSALDKLRNVTTSALPGPCPQLAPGGRVWIGWGTLDTVAGAVSQPALAARLRTAGVAVSAHAFRSEHVVSTSMVSSLLQWIGSPPVPSTTSSR